MLIRHKWLTLVLSLALFGASTTGAQNLPLYDPKLEFLAVMPNGADVDLLGPKIDRDDVGESYFDWKLVSSALSSDGKFMAVHYLGRRPKYWNAVVYLVGPSGKGVELKNSIVREVRWTDDGQYLLGFGDNTIRVWNTVGDRRQVTFGTINSYSYRGELLCVDATNYTFDQNGQKDRRVFEVYAIPTLKRLSSTPFTEVLGCTK